MKSMMSVLQIMLRFSYINKLIKSLLLLDNSSLIMKDLIKLSHLSMTLMYQSLDIHILQREEIIITRRELSFLVS